MYPCSKYLFNLQKPIIVWENAEKSLEGGNKKRLSLITEGFTW